jgi:hypothetical protein
MRLLALLSLALLPSCARLEVPGKAAVVGDSSAAGRLLSHSAKASGDPWSRYRQVEVSYSGEWSGIAKKVQPVLVDPNFRKSSVELYEPRSSRVRQVHTGPGGTKVVLRTPKSTKVSYAGIESGDPEVKAASALVADAYTAFLFGPSYLKTRASTLGVVAPRKVGDELCDGVQGTLAPGIGESNEDHFIAWIGRDSGLMKQFQFTIEGLESTKGADVEVTFSEHWKADDGTIWPRHFVERIVRPIPAKAHDWRMLSLKSRR